jgi:hypothetical protein
MVWDTIHARDVGRETPVEEWGGIAYALSAFEACGDPSWRLLPIIKVGADLSEPAHRFFRKLDTIDSLEGIRVVEQPNNRVELHYREAGRRCEHLRGGVPGWTAEELRPLVATCDAIYVNFIAGWELDWEAARSLRAAVDGPIYCDIHSLLLGVGPDGVRELRPLSRWQDWLACFDIVQTNEEELATLAGDQGDPLQLVAATLGLDTKAILVTLGPRGAAWLAMLGFWRNGAFGGDSDSQEQTVVSGLVECERPVLEGGDPTGCGDVWGMTCCASILAGDSLEESMRRANVLATRNAAFHGATDLAAVLRSEVALFPARIGS